MKSALPLPLLLLLALATPSITVPIPLRLEDCLRYESCRFAFPSIFSQQESERTPKNPHFPSRQLPPTSQDSVGDIKSFERLREQHPEAERPGLQSLNPKFEPMLRTSVGDQLSEETQAGELTNGPMIAEVKTIPIIEATHIETMQKTDARRYAFVGLSEDVWKKVESITSKSLPRCGTHRPTIIHHSSVGRDGWIITYSYSYRYTQTGYTDMLVIGVVILFIAAMLLVEGLDRAIRLTRDFLRLDEGQIQLEDKYCLHPDSMSPCSSNKYHLIPAPSMEKLISTSGSRELVDEKTSEP